MKNGDERKDYTKEKMKKEVGGRRKRDQEEK